jgi:hypothetical protein
MSAQVAGRADEGHEWLTKSVAAADRAIEIWRELSGKEYARAWANRAYALWQLEKIEESARSAAKRRSTMPWRRRTARSLPRRRSPSRRRTRPRRNRGARQRPA